MFHADDLRSSDPGVYEVAWAEFWESIAPTLDRIIERARTLAPAHVRNRIDPDEIRADTADAVFRAVLDRRIREGDPRRYAIGVVKMKCKRIFDKRRDPVPTLGSKSAVDRRPTVSRIITSKETRRAAQRGLERFRDNIERLSRAKRRTDVSAPLLQLLAIDLTTAGHGDPPTLVRECGLKEHTARRLRRAAADALLEGLTAEGAFQGSQPASAALLLDEAGPGTPLADLWVGSSHGCLRLMHWADAAHESHRSDMEMAKRLHLSLVGCEECLVAEERVGPSGAERWLRATRKSIATVRGVSGPNEPG